MPPVTNPHASDPDEAAVFELGYIAGFQDPAGDDSNFVPLAPEFLDIYVEGAEAGRADAHSPPGGDSSKAWVSKSELAPEGDSSTDEAIEHLTSFVIFKGLEMATRKAIFGLVDLVIMVVGIQGNVSPEQLRPLDDDFAKEYDGPEEDTMFYVAACPRKDHPQVQVGVTTDGFWSSSARHDFKEALKDAMHHGHRETFIARCDTQGLTCSAVWLGK
jgi:hypothetical protein